MELQLLIAGGIIASASLIGVVTTHALLGKFFTNNIRYLISFATGVFIVLTYTLLEEVFHEGDMLYTSLAIAIGFLFFAGLTTFLSKAHHHHGPTQEHSHSSIDARRMLLGDSLHNIGDGILLVPLFIASPVLGGAAIVGILIHEMVQEIAEFFVLKEAGYSTKMALFFNFLTALTIFIGIGIGLLVTDIEGVVIPLLAFTAGGFLHIILRDFIPSIFKSIHHECKPVPHIIFFVAGLILMILVTGGH
tara:strand:+ start:227037 stop:227780 length:744 start_codon:yes stop_codon:yes gene_type:complete